MIAQISAVNMNAQSDNLMEITASDGKAIAQAADLPSHESSV